MLKVVYAKSRVRVRRSVKDRRGCSKFGAVPSSRKTGEKKKDGGNEAHGWGRFSRCAVFGEGSVFDAEFFHFELKGFHNVAL